MGVILKLLQIPLISFCSTAIIHDHGKCRELDPVCFRSDARWCSTAAARLVWIARTPGKNIVGLVTSVNVGKQSIYTIVIYIYMICFEGHVYAWGLWIIEWTQPGSLIDSPCWSFSGSEYAMCELAQWINQMCEPSIAIQKNLPRTHCAKGRIQTWVVYTSAYIPALCSNI